MSKKKKDDIDITIKDNVKYTIKNGSLIKIELLTDTDIINIPQGVTSICKESFDPIRSNVKKIIIPDSVETIESEACSNLTNLTDVVIDEEASHLTIIGDEAFAYCQQLEEMHFPKSLTIISNSAFFNSGLKYVSFHNNLKVIKSNAFNGNKLTCVLISGGVTTIEDGAFANNPITIVTLGDNIRTIGNQAFANCIFLENINIPDGITHLGEDIFMNCFGPLLIYTTLEWSQEHQEFIRTLPETAIIKCKGYNEIPKQEFLDLLNSGIGDM